MNPHNWISALDPPGTPDRRWRCRYCGAEGSYDELEHTACGYEYPPCTSCGQTPTCSQDCQGIARALGSAGIRPVASADWEYRQYESLSGRVFRAGGQYDVVEIQPATGGPVVKCTVSTPGILLGCAQWMKQNITVRGLAVRKSDSHELISFRIDSVDGPRSFANPPNDLQRRMAESEERFDHEAFLSEIRG